ncbi:MAG: asparagine synthase-related protein [bacterium]|nr:asparagine synthase-related protein [bacterium]
MPGISGLVHLKGEKLDELIASTFLAPNTAVGDSPGTIYSYRGGSVCIATYPGRFDLVSPRMAQSEDRTEHLHLWGEIYNANLNSRQPADEILSRYCRESNRPLADLNGSFIFVHLNDPQRRLQIVCDRSASLPLYYYRIGDLFAFGSDLKAFLTLPNFKPVFDVETVSDFLACGFVLGQKTPLKDVRVLGPAEMLTLKTDQISLNRYWQFSFAETRDNRCETEIVAHLSHLITQAIDRRSSDDIPYGVLLSGGYDSRAILGCAKRLHPEQQLLTITWGETDKIPSSDAYIAQKLADWAQSQHTFYTIEANQLPDNFRSIVALNEGRTDAVGNYTDGLNTFIRIRDELGAKYILRGDECFGWRANVNTEDEALHSLSVHHLERLRQNYRYLRSEQRSRLNEANQLQMMALLSQCPHEYLHDRKDYFYFNWRIFGYLNPLSQLKQRALWIRNPFLDNDLLDLILRVPSHFRLGKALFKTAVKEMFPEFQKFEIARYNNLVDWDERMTQRPILQQFVRSILIENRNGFDELVDRPALVRHLDALFSAGLDQKVIHRRQNSLFRRLKNRWNRQLGRYQLSPSTELFRLMIIKCWADEFAGCDFRME